MVERAGRSPLHTVAQPWIHSRACFGRKGAKPSTEDAKKALYVHLASDGGIFAVRGTGQQAWLTKAQLDTELSELSGSGGRLIYSRDDPDRDPPPYVDDVFKRIVDSKPAGIQLLNEPHPVAGAHAKQDLTVLMMAAHQGDTDRLADLIARRVPPESRSRNGYTAW